jgi:hypothetical protein
MFYYTALLLSYLLQLSCLVNSFQPRNPMHLPFKSFSALKLSEQVFEPMPLDTSGFENAKFEQIAKLSPVLGKYRLEATIKASEFKGLPSLPLLSVEIPDMTAS